MRDICPATLSGSPVSAYNDICGRYCAERIEITLASHVGEYNVFYPFDEPPDDCEGHHASYCDELTVQAGSNTADRILQTVDICELCGNDFGNNNYTFLCALAEVTVEEIGERQLTLF